MILASAQINAKQGDIEANLEEHYKFVEVASMNNARLVVFPEMSISGYERENAQKLAFEPFDHRLDGLRNLALTKKIIIVAGAPVLIENKLFIGSFIIKPDQTISIYTKQYLHHGEEEFFTSSFNYNPLIEWKKERLSLAICADIDHPAHALEASKRNTTFYLPGIFFTPKGIHQAYQTLAGYANTFIMNVLMSNFCGHCWEMEAGGQSAFWDRSGKLIANLNGSDPGLLVVEKDNKGSWMWERIYL